MPCAETYMRSKCNTCEAAGRPSIIDPVVLFRLRDVESLWDELSFDPEWPFGKDHSMHRTHTSKLDLDVISRQGVATLLEKMGKLGAETVQRRIARYVSAGQVRR